MRACLLLTAFIIASCNNTNNIAPRTSIALSISGKLSTFSSFELPIENIRLVDSNGNSDIYPVKKTIDIAYPYSQYLGHLFVPANNYTGIELDVDLSNIQALTYGFNEQGDTDPLQFYSHDFLSPIGEDITEENKIATIAIDLTDIAFNSEPIHFIHLTISHPGTFHPANTKNHPIKFQPTARFTPEKTQIVHGEIIRINENEVVIDSAGIQFPISKVNWFLDSIAIDLADILNLNPGQPVALNIQQTEEKSSGIQGVNVITQNQFEGILRPASTGLVFMGNMTTPYGGLDFLTGVELPWSNNENTLSLQELAAGQRLQFSANSENQVSNLRLIQSDVTGIIFTDDDGEEYIDVTSINAKPSNGFFPNALPLLVEDSFDFTPFTEKALQGMFTRTKNVTAFKVFAPSMTLSPKSRNIKVSLDITPKRIPSFVQEYGEIILSQQSDITEVTAHDAVTGRPVTTQINHIHIAPSSTYKVFKINNKIHAPVTFTQIDNLSNYLINQLPDHVCTKVILIGSEIEGDFSASQISLTYEKLEGMQPINRDDTEAGNTDSTLLLSQEYLALEENNSQKSASTNRNVVIGSTVGIIGGGVILAGVIKVIKAKQTNNITTSLATEPDNKPDASKTATHPDTSKPTQNKTPSIEPEKNKTAASEPTETNITKLANPNKLDSNTINSADQNAPKPKSTELSAFDSNFNEEITSDDLRFIKWGTHNGGRFTAESGKTIFLKAGEKRFVQSEVFSSKLYQLANIPVLDVRYVKLTDQQKETLQTVHEYAVISDFDREMEQIRDDEERIKEVTKGKTDDILKIMVVNAWIKEGDSFQNDFNNVAYHRLNDQIMVFDLTGSHTFDQTLGYHKFQHDLDLKEYFWTGHQVGPKYVRSYLNLDSIDINQSKAIKDQLIYIQSLKKETLIKKLKEVYDYDDLTVSQMADRMIYRRVGIAIDIIPDNISPEDLNLYFSFKYGKNYANSELTDTEKKAFNKQRNTLIKLAKTGLTSTLDDFKTLELNYGKNFPLFEYYMSPEHRSIFRSNLHDWLKNDKVS
jgi:hypothetical protein